MEESRSSLADGGKNILLSPGHLPSHRNVGLDVVRSIAILLVLLCHCGGSFASWYGVAFPWQLAASGFYGVELFFVLSGFLIGGLLIDILVRGPTAREWLVFLVRRWMRTLPLYYIWVLILAFAWPPHFAELANGVRAHELPYYLALAQNIHGRVIGTWFAVSWSLTVEEWFYLLFSGMLFTAAIAIGKRAAILITLAAFLAIPALLRWHLPEYVNWDQVTAKAVIYRLDAIAFGVVVAWLSAKRARVLNYPAPLFLLGIFLIFMAWIGKDLLTLQFPPHTIKTFLFDTVSIGFALCLPAAMTLDRRAGAALSATARALSRQSYAMYIVHLPLIELAAYYRARMHMPVAAAAIATMLAIYCLSFLSYHYIELPILAKRPSQRA